MEGLKRCVRAGSLTVEVTLGEYVFEKEKPLFAIGVAESVMKAKFG